MNQCYHVICTLIISKLANNNLPTALIESLSIILEYINVFLMVDNKHLVLYLVHLHMNVPDYYIRCYFLCASQYKSLDY